MTDINAKLVKIQHELKAPKDQHNGFGNYNYRSLENILESVKPLLHEHGLTLTISDEIVAVGSQVYIVDKVAAVGSRFYVKATATISDGSDSISTTAYAREDESKKGMSESQITGACSSYARKYCVQGLFAIDDSKDPDTESYQRRQREDKHIMCEHCGNPIKPLTKRDGGTMNPADVARWTQREAHMTLCGDCLKAWRQAKAQKDQTNNNQ